MNIVVKPVRYVLLALPALLLLLTSCATTTRRADGPKFYEESAADLVVRYSSDQAIFRLKPDGHEGSFYQIFNREQLCAADAQRVGKRNLAVVVIGYHWTETLEQQVKQGWVDSLSKLNYHRIVFLRASNNDQVNGLRVVEDRQVVQVASNPREVGLVSAAPSQFSAR